MTSAVESMPRELLADIILNTKTKGVDMSTSVGLANAIVDALDRRGKLVADVTDVIDPPDAHVRTLKKMRRSLEQAIEEGVPARDLASLSRRLQDVSREVTSIEERYRAADKVKGNKSNGSSHSSPRAKNTGSLSI